MLELAAHSIAHDRTTNLTPDDEASSRSGEVAVSTLGLAELEVRIGKCKVDDEPRRAARRPDRMVAAKSERWRSRDAAGSTGSRDSGRRQAERP